MQDIHSLASHTNAGVEKLKSDGHFDKLRRWLSPSDPSTNLNAAKEKRHEGTGDWFINSDAFSEWKSGSRRHLWLHGLAGCGKTVLTSTILDHLRSAPADSFVCLDFFFDFRDKENSTSITYCGHSLLSYTYNVPKHGKNWIVCSRHATRAKSNHVLIYYPKPSIS